MKHTYLRRILSNSVATARGVGQRNTPEEEPVVIETHLNMYLKYLRYVLLIKFAFK